MNWMIHKPILSFVEIVLKYYYTFFLQLLILCVQTCPWICNVLRSVTFQWTTFHVYMFACVREFDLI
jgi:hypothetical protein